MENAYIATNVLIVEDNKMNQRLLGIILEKGGYTLTLANDGEEAIRYFENQKFDIILMDCQMPKKNGFQTTIEIRSIEKILRRNPTPILALTANAMLGDREKCLASGMTDFLAKPFQMNTLLEKLNLLTSKIS